MDKKDKQADRIISIHEAAHFVIYLKNCKARKKGFHHIKTITIDGQPIFLTEDFDLCRDSHKYLVSHNLKLLRDLTIKNIQSDIIFHLAGCAAELFNQTGRCPGNFGLVMLLKINFKHHLDEPGSDFESATELVSYLGGEKSFANETLLKLYRKAFRQVKAHWQIINEVAEQLEEKRTISDDELYSLAEHITERL